MPLVDATAYQELPDGDDVAPGRNESLTSREEALPTTDDDDKAGDEDVFGLWNLGAAFRSSGRCHLLGRCALKAEKSSFVTWPQLALRWFVGGGVPPLFVILSFLAVVYLRGVYYDDLRSASYLRGWNRAQFISCTTGDRNSDVPTDLQCPARHLDLPPEGCDLTDTQGGPPVHKRLLLLSDGLSSPSAERAFQQILTDTAEARAARRRTTTGGAGSTSPNASSVSIATNSSTVDDDRGVLLVLDAAYRAWVDGLQFISPQEYCGMRKEQLSLLGASEVSCVLLDPTAREDSWKRTTSSRRPVGGGVDAGAGTDEEEERSFGEMMRRIDDDFLVQELNRSAIVWLDLGSPHFLLRSLQRPLLLSPSMQKIVAMMFSSDNPYNNSSGPSSHREKLGSSSVLAEAEAEVGNLLQAVLGTGNDLTFGELIRHRVLDGSGTLAYVGVSAGTILAGDEVGWITGDWDTRLRGLRLVPNCTLYPHAEASSFKNGLEAYAEKFHMKVMGIPNCQHLVDWGDGQPYLSYVCPGW